MTLNVVYYVLATAGRGKPICSPIKKQGEGTELGGLVEGELTSCQSRPCRSSYKTCQVVGADDNKPQM